MSGIWRTLYSVPPAEEVEVAIPLRPPRYCSCGCGQTLSYWNRTGLTHACQQKRRFTKVNEAARDQSLAPVGKAPKEGVFGSKQAREALFLQACGLSLAQLAERYGVSWITVQRSLSDHRAKCHNPDCDCRLIERFRGSKGRPSRRKREQALA